MPTDKSVTLVKGTIPPGLCFTNIPELYSTFVDTTTAYVDGNYSLFNYGNQAPSADDIDKPWIKLDGDGRFERVYGYSDGYWVAPHPCPALGKERRIWTGTPEELKVYEDNSNTLEAADANLYRGPFWEVDTTLTAPQSSNTSYEADIYDTESLSAIHAMTGESIVTQDHQLGELPDSVSVSFRCITDDAITGYVADDEVPIYSTWVNENSSHRDTPTLGIVYDETKVTLILAQGVNDNLDSFEMFKKDSDRKVSPTGNNWKFRIRVWRRGGNPVSTSSTNFSYIKRTRRVYYTG